MRKLFIVFFLFYQLGVAFAAANFELAENGGFEQLGSCIGVWDNFNTCPNQFYGYQPDSNDTDFDTLAYLDNNVLSIKINSATGYTRAGVTQSLAGLTEGDTYKFSALIKTKKLNGQVRLIITEKDINNLQVDQHQTFGSMDTSTWTKVEMVRTVPNGTDKFSFTVMASTNYGGVSCSADCGEVLVDNYSIEKLSSSIPSYEGFSSVCADGEFLVLLTE